MVVKFKSPVKKISEILRGMLRPFKRYCSLVTVILTSCILAACSSAPPQDYPNFYKGWQGVQPELKAELDQARKDVSSPQVDSERVLRFARLAGRLARVQASKWLATVESKKAALYSPVTKKRNQVVESCRHALSLYQEAEILNGPIEWQDEINQVWLFILSNRDEEALNKFSDLLSRPSLSPELEKALRELELIVQGLDLESDE